jgi:O-antigen/teichoic acid export membrane protein
MLTFFLVCDLLEFGMKDLKRRAVRGVLAKLSGQAAAFGLRAMFVVVLARLLDPKDFGLVAMVTAVTGIYDLFTHAGLSMATIQKAEISNEQVSTLFWINILVGIVLGLLCLATAPILVAFYNEPRLFWITLVMSTGFLINAAGVQHFALLERQLRYVAITAIGVFVQVASLCVGIGMALGGFGYWALVGAAIVQPVVSTICVWAVASWIPDMPHRRSGIRAMLRFGGTITLNSLVVYIAYNIDKILIGRFWGADALGIYGRAYQLINIPTSTINTAIGGVTFSALSRLQQDPTRLKRYFLQGYSIMISISIPLTIFSAIWANDIILVLLGPKWNDAAAIFRLLTPTILIFGMIDPLFWLMISTGLQERSLKIAVVIAFLVIASYLIGLPYGPPGVALAFSVAMTLWVAPHIIWCLRGTVVSVRDLLSVITRPLLAGIVAAALTLLLQSICGQFQSHLLLLACAGGVMFILYASILLFVLGQKDFYLDLLKNFKPA